MNNVYRRLLLQGASVVILALGCSIASQPLRAASAIQAKELSSGVYLLQGAGCNVIAVKGPEGALVIDGGLKANSDALYAAIKQATGNDKIKTLINTHWHPEQVGLNERAARDGATIIAHAQTLLYLSHRVDSTLVKGLVEPLPEAARPTMTTRNNGSVEFAGQTIEYGYLPAAHTNGDLYVYFPKLNLLAAGGAVGSDSWPLIDYRNGAFIGGLVRTYEKLAELVKPDTTIIPAQGRAMTGAELVVQRTMYQKLFVDLNGLMNKGMGFNDVVAVNPLKEYEGQYGSAATFLDGAFRSMEMAYVPD